MRKLCNGPSMSAARVWSVAPALTALLVLASTPSSAGEVRSGAVGHASNVAQSYRASAGAGKWNSVSALEREIHSRKAAIAGAVAAGKVRAGRDAEEAAGVDFLEAKLWYLKQRAYPNDRVDWSAYNRAAQQRKRMPRVGAAKTGIGILGTTSKVWEYLGPNNLDIPYRIYYGVRPLSGRINAVAYASADRGLTFDVYYAAGASGGIWKSVDKGVTWVPITDDWDTLNVSSIAVDPFDNDIVYVGTGDFHGMSGYSMGVMKTTNGGKSWKNIGPWAFYGSVSEIMIDPEDPEIVHVAGDGGLYRTPDGGATWSKTITANGSWNALVYGEGVGGLSRPYYVAGTVVNGTTANCEVWRSTNQGLTWVKVGSPGTSNAQASVDLATSKINGGTVYAIMGSEAKLWRSTNMGTDWKEITNNFPGGYNWSQSFYDYHITSSWDTGRDQLYVGLIDLAQTLNANTGDEKNVTWRSVGGPSYSMNSILHNDQHSMAFNPLDPQSALVGHDGGIYGFNYDPSKDEWSYNYATNTRIGVTQFYFAAFHPTDPTKVLGGTQDNASPTSLGDLDNWSNVGGGDGGFCAINPVNPSIQYATSQGLTIYRTDDEWQTSDMIEAPDSVADPRAFIAPIALDPGNPRYLYAGTNYLYRWDEQLKKWSGKLGMKRLSLSGVISCIAVAPSDSKRIYTGSGSGELFMSTNAGQTWIQINKGMSPFLTLPNRYITSIAVHPRNPSFVLVTLSGFSGGHVYRCVNTAFTQRAWMNVSGVGVTALPNVPANHIAFDPSSPDSQWYVGTDFGVFLTSSSGNYWADMTTPLGLPNVQVNTVVPNAKTGYLNVATYGRGIWRLPLSAASAGVPIQSLTVVPDPVQGGGLRDDDPNSRVPITGVVALSSIAPQGGQLVSLSSDNPAVVNLPASVTVPSGLTTKVFKFNANEVAAPVTVVITAKSGKGGVNTSLRVLPLPLVSVAVAPSIIKGGQVATGTVTLRSAAPTGGATVALSSSSAAAVVPAVAFVKPGATTGTFQIQTKAGASAVVSIRGSYSGATRSASLTVKP